MRLNPNSLRWAVLMAALLAAPVRAQLAQAQPCAPEAAAALYRKAFDTMNQNNNAAAAQLFSQLAAKYPKSVCTQDALYWQAFTLYRIGTPKELRQARTVLETQRTRYPEAYARSDARSLSQRIAGTLAQQGDDSAVRATIEGAGGKPTCDKEEMAVRLEALNALTQFDLSSARPIVEKLLDRRDDCSRSLRKQIVLLLGRQQNEDAAKLLSQVVRDETDTDIRNDALIFLTRIPNEDTLALLRKMYPRVEGEPLKSTILNTVIHNPSPDSQGWLLDIVRDAKEPEDRRSQALQSAMQLQDIKIGEFVKLYDKVPGRDLRQKLIAFYASREESAATDKLMAIARSETDPQLLRSAIGALTNKSDPRTQQLLINILERK